MLVVYIHSGAYCYLHCIYVDNSCNVSINLQYNLYRSTMIYVQILKPIYEGMKAELKIMSHLKL